MKYAIVYSSNTGNTKELAETIFKTLKEQQSSCIYYGTPSTDCLEADVIFFGFWTDKGTCAKEAQEILLNCSRKKVFVFGTAGFGGDQAYFDRILTNVTSLLPADATIIGSYMCQGKMPASVRNRYETMPGLSPEKRQEMIENFDRALSHPDDKDRLELQDMVIRTLERLENK